MGKLLTKILGFIICLAVAVYGVLSSGSLDKDKINIGSESRRQAVKVITDSASSLFNDKVYNDKKLERFQGIAYGVYDGDTCWIKLSDESKVKLRFAHIDAPEKKQRMGLESQKFLANLIDGREITAVVEGTDRYGRKVVRVYCDNKDVNAEMVINGYAWHYKNFDKPGSEIYRNFEKYESEARAARLGIWQDDSPEAPWDYRRKSNG